MPPAVNDRAKIGIAAERGVAVMLFALVVSPVFYFSLFFFLSFIFMCTADVCALPAHATQHSQRCARACGRAFLCGCIFHGDQRGPIGGRLG